MLREERKYFSDGMNLDADERLLSKGEYRYALNMRNSNTDQGAGGAMSMLEGNTQTSDQGANGRKIIGAIDDPANDRGIFILFDPDGEHKIVVWDYKNDFDYVAYTDRGDYLGLTDNDKISGIDVVNTEGDTHLLFVNAVGEPKNVNIDQGLRSQNTSTDYDNQERFVGIWISGTSSAKASNIYFSAVSFTATDGTEQYEARAFRAKVDTTQDPNSSLSVIPNSDWELCPAGRIFPIRTVQLSSTGSVTSGSFAVGDAVWQDTINGTKFGFVLYYLGGATPRLLIWDLSNKMDDTITDLYDLTGVDFIQGGTWTFEARGGYEYIGNQIVPHPENRAETRFTTNEKYPFNNLRGSYWQFKYKYILADGRESKWSEVSTQEPAFYRPDSLIEASDFQSYNDNNQIDIYLEAPDTFAYKSVKVAVRRVNNDRSPDDWYLIDEIKSTDTSKYVYTDSLKIKVSFNNGNVLSPIDSRDANQLFSWIPLNVRAQAITSRNRVVYANFTEGRDFDIDGNYGLRAFPPTVAFYEDNNPFNTSLGYPCAFDIYSATSTAATSFTLEKSSTGSSNVFFFSDPVDGSADEVIPITFSSITVGRPITLKVVGTNYLKFNGSTSSGAPFTEVPKSVQFTYVPTSTAVSAAVSAFAAAFNNTEQFHDNQTDTNGFSIDYYGLSATTGTSTAGTAGSVPYLFLIPNKHPDYPTNPSYTEIRRMIGVYSNSVENARNFKRGTTQKFGIVYEGDYGRMSSVITHPNLTVYNSWWRDETYSALTGASDSGRAANKYVDVGARFALMNIRHDAPSWAKKYYVVKSLDNGLDNYVQLPLVKNTDLPDPTTNITNPFNGKYFVRGYVVDPELDEALVGSLGSAATALGGEEFIYIPLNSLQGNAQSYNGVKDSSITYQYTEGDRLRFCYGMTTSFSPTVTGRYVTEELDFEIVKYIESLNCVALRVGDFPTDWTSSASTAAFFGGVFGSDNEAGSGEGAGAATVGGLVFEVYTPTRVRTDNYFYELYSGTVSADTANGRYYHIANSLEDEQNQTSAQVGIVRLLGDSYLKPRTYPFLVDSKTLSGLASTANTKYATIYIEDANYFDKVESKTVGYGRPNRIVRNTSLVDDYAGNAGSIRLPNTLRYTEPFLPEQGYNGFGTIYDLNFKDTNSTKQAITKLVTEGDRLIIFHEDAVGYSKSDRQVIETVDGGGLTVAADTPISDPVYYGTTNGTIHPESVAVSDYRKYFFDANRGQVCRLSMDGIEPISRYGMNKFFSDISRDAESAEYSRFVGAYDRRFDEYVLMCYRTVGFAVDSGDIASGSGTTFTATLSSVSSYDLFVGDRIPITEDGVFTRDWATLTTISGNNLTFELDTAAQHTKITGSGFAGKIHLPLCDIVTWSERLKKWTSFADYVPDWIVGYGLSFHSYFHGNGYIHNDYNNPCSFYGTDHDAYVDVISNDQPDMVKQWISFAIKSDVIWGSASTFTPEIEVPSAATLSTTDFAMDAGVITSSEELTTTPAFKFKEQQLVAPYLRTKTASAANYIEGNKMKGYWQKTRIRFNGGGTKIYKVFSVLFRYVFSQFTR